MTVTQEQVIKQCQVEVHEAICILRENGYTLEANELNDDAQTATAVHDWLDLRETAAKWADRFGIDIW